VRQLYNDDIVLFKAQLHKTGSQPVYALLGLEKDDVVIIQLPNIVEAALMRLALPRAGILAVTVMPAFGPAEVRHILEFTRAKGIVIPKTFRKRDYYQMLREFYDELEVKPKVFVTGDKTPPGAISVDAMLKDPAEEEISPLVLSERMITTWEIQELNTTTGSTGMPKISESYGWNQLMGHVHLERWKLTGEDRLGLLVPFPGGIANNFWAGGIIGGCKMAFLEHFDTTEAFKFVERERITILCGVTTIADSMVKAENRKEFDLSSLRIFFLAGAPTPPALAEEIERELNCKVIILLGSMDFGPISETSVDDRPEVRYTSVGKPLFGTEVKAVDEKGEEVPKGEPGELICRGPYSFTGYYKRPEFTLDSYGGDKDGWFRTGDQVKIDGEGNLYVVGRLKDIIKRGGMTIVPTEIEHLLRLHPKVKDVAAVSMPDPALGEKVCAYVILAAGVGAFGLEEMASFLDSKGFAKFKWPERLEVVDEFPMVGGQKVHKKKLAEMIADKLKAEGKI
ncbi:MAG: AMP-binding protein, partial [Thermodesulfobacteriota bacterium]|nr:AMP-binding protein [Thermodesulfobacteriota bacterium]